MKEPRAASSLRSGRVLLMLLALPLAALGHHSFAMFDRSRTVTLEGVVRSFEWTNPHCRLWVNVPDGQQGSTLWGIEGSAVSMLGRAGWTKRSINPGDRVKVTLYPLRDGRPGGFFYQVVFEDGRKLYFKPGSEPQTEAGP